MFLLCWLSCLGLGIGENDCKGPKVRRFPLQFTIPTAMSLAGISDGFKHEIWHKQLGHPNMLILSHLLKYGFLDNKD